MRSDLYTRPSATSSSDRACCAADASRTKDDPTAVIGSLPTALLGPRSQEIAEEDRQRLLMSLEMVVTSFEGLIDALAEDERSTNRTLALLDEAYAASTNYRAA